MPTRLAVLARKKANMLHLRDIAEIFAYGISRQERQRVVVIGPGLEGGKGDGYREVRIRRAPVPADNRLRRGKGNLALCFLRAAQSLFSLDSCRIPADLHNAVVFRPSPCVGIAQHAAMHHHVVPAPIRSSVVHDDPHAPRLLPAACHWSATAVPRSAGAARADDSFRAAAYREGARPCGDLAKDVDVLLGNLEDAVPVEAKEAARSGFIEMAKAGPFGTTALWTRINALGSPWVLDDLTQIVGSVGDRLDVIMLPKVEGPWDIHYLDQLLAQLEARHSLTRPILIHAILETAEGVKNVESIALASPRMQGISLGPADLAASRAMKTTRVGGGHPGYKVLSDPVEGQVRASSQQDPWHYTMARMVDACAAAGIKPFYGPFGDFGDSEACEAQFRNAFLLGCAGAWTLHPSQIGIAKRVFSPDPAEVAFARRILAAMPNGSGAVMIDGKMQDDATWKQAKVLCDLADEVARKDPELAAAYAASSGPQAS